MTNPFESFGASFEAHAPLPKVRAERGQPGSGKTSRLLRLIVPHVQAGMNVVVAVSRHELGDEHAAALAVYGITGRVFRGREADDPEAGNAPDTGEPLKMCLEPERVALLKEAGGTPSRHACRFKGIECQSYGKCGYQRQRRQKPDVWLVPHQLLFEARREFIPQPDLVVIDESFWGATLHGTEELYKVPVDALVHDRHIPHRIDDTGDLRAISRIVHEVAKRTNGRLSRRDLIAAGGSVADCSRAHKLEWMRKAPLMIEPGAPIEQVRDSCQRVGAHNQLVERLARLWKLLTATMEMDGEELSPWIEVQADQIGEGFPAELSFVLGWRDEIHDSWSAKTILLDATLQPEIVHAFFPQAEIAKPTRFPTPHVRVRQISDTAFAASKTIPSKGASAAENKRRLNNVERLRRYIEVRAAAFRPGKVVVICQKKLRRELERGPLPENVELGHYNNITGLNAWSDAALLIVIGRTEPAPRTVERIARALFGKMVTEIEPDQRGVVRYWRRRGRIRLPNGTAVVVENNGHPDPLAEAVRWAICEAELLQAIGRGRGIRRTADDPLQIDILTNIALPRELVEVTETMPWRLAQPGYGEVMAARGAVPLCYADMHAAYGDLFESRRAAESAMQREASEADVTKTPGNPTHFPIERYLIGKCVGFLSVGYQRPGVGGPARRLLYDPARVDPRAWLTARLGKVTLYSNELEEAAPAEAVAPHAPATEETSPEPAAAEPQMSRKIKGRPPTGQALSAVERKRRSRQRKGAQPAAAASVHPAGVPFMITAAMRAELRQLGYTDDQVRELTPQQAHGILAAARRPEAEAATSAAPRPSSDLKYTARAAPAGRNLQPGRTMTTNPLPTRLTAAERRRQKIATEDNSAPTPPLPAQPASVPQADNLYWLFPPGGLARRYPSPPMITLCGDCKAASAE